MFQGRGNAVVVGMVVMILAVTSVVLQCEAATYTVGDAGGWTFNVANWPKGKSFMAGDTLVFNYHPENHNVVAVDNGGYNSCTTTPSSAKVYQTGKDQIKLVKGQNFFICSIPGHCQSGMKIAVTAA